MTTPHTNIINGVDVAGASTVEVKNPATDEVIGHRPVASTADVDAAVQAARAAQPAWAAQTDAERVAVLMKIADAIGEQVPALAEWVVKEQGKPLLPEGPGALFEAQGCVGWIQATCSLELPVEVVFEDDTRRDELHYSPHGVVAAVVPWNWPILIATWSIIPALRMGNTVVLKPSEHTTLCTLELARIINQFLPAGVLNVVCGAGEVGAHLTGHRDIDKVVFTGSAATGKRIAEAAAGNLTRLTLELGGNDAAVVLPGCDPKAIAEGLFWGAFLNMGQTCAAAKRLYVHDSIYDEVVDALAAIGSAMPMGNGMDDGIVIGPIQNAMQFGIVNDLVEDAKAAGARVACGGEAPQGPGFFYPITVVADIDNDARLVCEEQFGPVVPVIRYHDVEDAITMANALDVGLGGSVWSPDEDQARAVAARLEAGTVWINSHGMINPLVPFGGVKGSGYGVEFGIEGLKGMAAPKIVSLTKLAG